MNLMPELQTVLEDLTRRFGAQIARVPAPQANELYLDGEIGTGRRPLLGVLQETERAAGGRVRR